MEEITCKQQKQAGFTLPELLVVLFLLSLLSAFLMQCLFTLTEQQKQRLAFLELEDNLNLAMDWLKADIEKSCAVSACSQEQLVLQQPRTGIQYTLGIDQQATEHLYPLEGKILYRKENIQWNRQPMANFIETFTISYLDKYGQLTEEPTAVCAVGIHLTGCWQNGRIEKQQIVRLMKKGYL